jgi:hypothetical protein
MPNYTEFEGVNLITDPTKKVIGDVLVKNELGGISNGYQLDHADTSNSGFSFGGNQMDLGYDTKADGSIAARNQSGRGLFENIITHELGSDFLNSIKDRAYSNGNSSAFNVTEFSQINSALSSNYAKPLINQEFATAVDNASQKIDNFADFLGTSFTDDVKIALIDYDNQFNISFDTSKSVNMAYKLANILQDSGTVTLSDVENSIRSTGQYKNDENHQENRIQETRKTIQDAELVNDESTSEDSVQNALETAVDQGVTVEEKVEITKSWFETFTDSLGSFVDSTTTFLKDTASFLADITGISTVAGWISDAAGWVGDAFTDGTYTQIPDYNLIDNSQLKLTINTENLEGFSSNQDATQNGNIIGDGDWSISGPISDLNGDGVQNVLPYGIAADFMRYGNAELSAYGNFDTQILDNLSKVDNLSTNLNSGSFQLNNPLQSALADLSNNAIDARSFLNIDPVVLDLNGDGVKLISYGDSNVSFDVDNDGFVESTGWVAGTDGILVEDKNQDGFFRQENANSVFRKNEHFALAKSRARFVFKCEARRKATKRVDINSILKNLKTKSVCFLSANCFLNTKSKVKGDFNNDNFANDNLKNCIVMKHQQKIINF